MKAYMIVIFLATFGIGIAEIVNGIGAEIAFIPADIVGGIAMVVISAIFLRGVVSEESKAYYYVGSVILAVFGVLYIFSNVCRECKLHYGWRRSNN
ncbi:hypothetical protein DRO97_06780 [Archaeoglobales archaeon]|nr:MAG: hypothetical protein DRO97_06780 [Archaeoglobales archaeon]